MKITEVRALKKGDLVVITHKAEQHYKGLVLEIADDNIIEDFVCCRVKLKQPGFNCSFILENYDTRRLQRYES